MIASLVVLASLVIFWGVSLRNVLSHKGNSDGPTRSENPLSPAFSLALLGTLFLFAESLVFAYLGIIGTNTRVIGSIFTFPPILQAIGTITYALGALLHAWSVTVRGRHAVSWAMPEDHTLVTDPPYSIVRHPSYLGYMFMMVGMTLAWGNVVTLIPWIAIPGYYLVSLYEEAMLLEQFGDEYRAYMNRVGGFIPRLGGPRVAQEET